MDGISWLWIINVIVVVLLIFEYLNMFLDSGVWWYFREVLVILFVGNLWRFYGRYCDEVDGLVII